MDCWYNRYSGVTALLLATTSAAPTKLKTVMTAGERARRRTLILFVPFCLLRACCVCCTVSRLTCRDKSILLSNPRSSNKRWASSMNSVDAAGLPPQKRAFVGLCHSPAFDRNYAGKERTKLSFGFLQDRRTHHIDAQSLGKLDGGSPSKTFQRARDGCSRGAGEDRFVVENARNQGEGSPFVDGRDRILDQTDLAHDLAPQQKLPFFSGELRKGSKSVFPCRNGHGVKRTGGLI